MKKLVGAVVGAFIVFYLFSQPERSADVVRNAVDLAGQGFDAIVTFLTALFR